MDPRPYMLLDLTDPLPASERGSIRPIRDEDLPELAGLMVDAYAGTVDDEGEDRSAALRELRATASGTYGPALRHAWSLEHHEGAARAALLVTRWHGIPFIAFVFTHPDARGHGIATGLILDAARELRSRGETSLSLVVTRRNPASALYRRLGFIEMPRPEGD